MFVDLLPTVYEEGGALLAHDTDELVHDAAGHPRVRVLRPLTRQRLLLVRLCPAARQLLQEGVEGHLINNDNNDDDNNDNNNDNKNSNRRPPRRWRSWTPLRLVARTR